MRASGLLLSAAMMGIAALSCDRSQAQETRDSVCQMAGALGYMLGYVDGQCRHYQLTSAGRVVQIKTAALMLRHAFDTDLDIEKCMQVGKVAMLLKVNKDFPHISRISDPEAFSANMCGAIVVILGNIGAGKAPLISGKR